MSLYFVGLNDPLKIPAKFTNELLRARRDNKGLIRTSLEPREDKFLGMRLFGRQTKKVPVCHPSTRLGARGVALK